MNLQFSEQQFPFSRTFVRNIVKDLEVNSCMYLNDFNLYIYIIGKDQKHNKI